MFTIPLRITVVITAAIRFPNNTTCRSRAEEMIDPVSIPQLNKHFRLQWEEAQDCYVLLYPEGMVKLNSVIFYWQAARGWSRALGLQLSEGVDVAACPSPVRRD